MSSEEKAQSASEAPLSMLAASVTLLGDGRNDCFYIDLKRNYITIGAQVVGPSFWEKMPSAVSIAEVSSSGYSLSIDPSGKLIRIKFPAPPQINRFHPVVFYLYFDCSGPGDKEWKSLLMPKATT